jgi:hypothetical protein
MVGNIARHIWFFAGEAFDTVIEVYYDFLEVVDDILEWQAIHMLECGENGYRGCLPNDAERRIEEEKALYIRVRYLQESGEPLTVPTFRRERAHGAIGPDQEPEYVY